MPEKILFISSANLTVNPRILKELKFAVNLYYDVDFVGFKLGNWSDEIDKGLIKNINANFHYISITRKPAIQWLINSLIEKISKKIYPYFKKNLKINAFAHSKRSVLLNNYLRKNKTKYDLIIAHTLPCLYSSYKFAKNTNTKFTFDIEDYHPGEGVAVDAANEKARRIFLMQQLLPKVCFMTYASPLIGEHSLKLLNKYQKSPLGIKHQLINNCFSKEEFQFKENTSSKIKFVWFSQNISAGRGLELVIPALAKFKDIVELYLIGNLYPVFNDTFLSKYAGFIKIIPSLPQKDLNLMLSEFDIGLAIELNSADFNRQICLTNKIWAYTQAGLFVLATDTPAQMMFLKENKDTGIITSQNKDGFTDSIEKIIADIDNIRKNKQARFNDTQNLAWENESEKLSEIWKVLESKNKL